MAKKNQVAIAHPYHTEAVRLDNQKTHEAFLSLLPAKNLLVFIHGFNGKAVLTWNKFPSKLAADASFAETDIIFYGYKSLQRNRNAGNYASDLLIFLKQEIDAIPAPGNIARIAGEKKLTQRNGYEKIILVAHSLGAIVLRKALMNAKADTVPWLEKVQMLLIAPAHLGAKVDKLIFGVLDIILIGKLLANGLSYFYPVLEDLKEKSVLLDDLKDDTRMYLQINQGDFTKAKIVIHSDPDGIVTNGRFESDPQEITVNGSSHTEVCKPNENYNVPFEKLLTLI